MKAAFLAFEECSVWQVALLQMFLRKSGWTMRTLTLDGQSVVTDGGLRLVPDGGVERAAPRDYNLVLMAGGTPQPELAEDPRLHRFLRQYDGQRGLIAACAESVPYVAAAGLLGGLRVTTTAECYLQFEPFFHGTVFTGQDVCFDGNIVTSQGRDASAFARAVCTQLGMVEEIPQTSFGQSSAPALNKVQTPLSGRSILG